MTCRTAPIAIARCCGGVLLAAAAAWLLGSGTAQAQEPEGPAEPLEVTEVRLLGVEQVHADALAASLATRSSPWWPWSPRRYFDAGVLEADLMRIVEFYASQGFPDARVVSHEVRRNLEEREAEVVIRIAEGEPVTIAEVVFDGFEVLPAVRFARLRDVLPIAAGARAVRADIEAARDLSRVALQNDGFAYSMVRIEQETLPEQPKRLRLRLVAEPGPRALFGSIDIAGNVTVADGIVRRELAYRPGELFSVAKLQESQRQLYALELFEFVGIEPLESAEPIDVPTRVTVREGDHQDVLFSGGWAGDEKLNGELAWRHRNFLGGARVLSARGRMSALDSGGEVDLRQPYLFHRNLSLAINAHAWYVDDFAYEAESEGGHVTLAGRLPASAVWSVSYTHEDTSTRIPLDAYLQTGALDALIGLGLDPITGAQDGLLSSVSLAIARGRPDTGVAPQRGYGADLRIEQAGRLLPGDFDYMSASVEVRGYLPLGRRVELAARVHGAAIDAADGPSGVPFFKRYFLGGATGPRGWGRFEVAPLSPGGLPLGGFSVFETGAELRTLVWGGVTLVAFLDAGNVWRDEWDIRPGDLRYAAGPGVRYLSPFGPLRIDLGYQLTPIDGLLVDGEPQDRRWRLHVNIGQSF